MIKASAMLLRHICRVSAARKLEEAMASCPVEVNADQGITAAMYADELMKLL